ncbi:MAG: WcaF family extracellular polysaccharide biosynthesis acetyltransferase [Chitinophagaceae bacterium]
MQGEVDLSKYNNDWYTVRIGASRVKQLAWYLVNIIFFINPLNFNSSSKVWLLKLFGARMGRNVIIKPGVNIKYPWLLEIGDYSWIGEKTWIDNLTGVFIGKNVCISQGAMLLTGNHDYKKVSFNLMVSGINLNDGVWIGARSVVCPGVTCETHAVLTALSVATSNLSSYKVYQGNPARVIRERTVE